MTANISYQGTDLDLIYETPRLGAATSNVNFQSQVGSPTGDLAGRYTAITNATTGNGNIASRIPPTGRYFSNGIDYSSIFIGAASNFSLTSPTPISGSNPVSQAGFTSPVTKTHTITVTFSSASALTNYFTYGGRLIIVPGQTTGTSADNNLKSMFDQIVSLTIYDQGCYITGSGGANITVTSTGGKNFGTGLTTILSATEPATYTSNLYQIKVQANAVSGAASVLTITTILTIATAGSIPDTYTGTYSSLFQQRNYNGLYISPAQSAPSISVTFT